MIQKSIEITTNSAAETIALGERIGAALKGGEVFALIGNLGTGKTHLAIAEELGITNVTVGKWRRRFVERRVDGLLDEPRPGQPRTITDEDVERVIVTTLEQKPDNATH